MKVASRNEIIEEDGSDNYSGDIAYFSDDAVYILTANNAPSLFKAAYQNIDEMISEFRQLLGNYLPNFNYRSNINHFVGTYFG